MRIAPVAAAILLSSAPMQASAQSIFPYEHTTVTLPNGLTAVLIPGAGAPGLVTFVSMVRTGSRDEVEQGRSGFAHFFEHMMFRGTDRYPDYDAAIERIGAAGNAFTSNDMTVYYMTAGSEHLDYIMDVESDRFRNLEYAEPDFRTEAGAVLGEYQQSATTPGGMLNEKVRELAFTRHTYGHTTIGYEADVRAMPQAYEYSLTFFDRFYRPENVVLVIAGDFDPAEAERLVRRHYGDWGPGYEAPQVPQEPPQTAPRADTIRFPGRTVPLLDVNWKAPAWDPADRIAVATEVLGRVAFGANSDLYRRVVIQERKATSLTHGFSLSRDPGLVSVTASVPDAADIAYVDQQILAAAARFREQLVDSALLADAKSNMKYGFLMGLETSQNVAFALIRPIVFTGGVAAIERYFATLETVTAGDVREAARRVLVESGRTTVTLLPEAR